jgi:hypothetical protein
MPGEWGCAAGSASAAASLCRDDGEGFGVEPDPPHPTDAKAIETAKTRQEVFALIVAIYASDLLLVRSER